MKHFVWLFICLFGLLGNQLLFAQEVREGMVYVRQNKAEIKNDSVFLEMDINIHGVNINKRESLHLFPTLFHETDSIKLPPIVLNGKTKQRKINRTIAIEGKYAPQEKAYVILENVPTTHWVVSYKINLPKLSWMDKAGLKLIGEIKNQDEDTLLILSDLLTDDLQLTN